MTDEIPNIPRFARNSAAMTPTAADVAAALDRAFWAVRLDPAEMSPQSVRSLQTWLNSRGPGEHLSEALREILAVLSLGGTVVCSRPLNE